MKHVWIFTRFFLVAISLLAMVHSVAHANDTPSLRDVVLALEKGYSALRDVRADFTQTTKVAGMGREQRGNGEVFLKRASSGSAMFRFNYVKPKQQIISNGKQVWFYLPDDGQVIVSAMNDAFAGDNNVALSYLTGIGHVSRDFSISFAKERQDKSGNYQLEMTPKKTNPMLSKLLLNVSVEVVERFQKEGVVMDIFPIVSSIVYDAGGNQTRIDYSRPKVNRGIGNGVFNFKIPKGVDVIQQ